MGWEAHYIEGIGCKHLMGFYTNGVPNPNRKTMYGKPYEDVNKLKFNYSWDWLMPVVEKIEDLRFDTRILRAGTETEYTMCEITDVLNNEIAIQSHQNKITAVYNTVVEFIKWYKTTNLK